MNSFKLFKRNVLIRLMTLLGFGGMAAFCISSCQQGSSNNDKQPSQATNPQDSAQPSPQVDLPAEDPTTATNAQNPDQQNDKGNNSKPDNNTEPDNNSEPEQPATNSNNSPDSANAPQKNTKSLEPVYPPKEYGAHRPRLIAPGLTVL